MSSGQWCLSGRLHSRRGADYAIGGISYFSPRVGFVCDNIVDYEVVLSNGIVTHANATANYDLWVALKEGSNNFGVVTRFTARTFPTSDVWGGFLYHTISQAPKVLEAFHQFVGSADYDEYAASPLLSLGYLSKWRASAVANWIVYTKPVKHPACFGVFTSIRRIWITLRVKTLSDAARELDEIAPPGKRYTALCSLSDRIPPQLTDHYSIGAFQPLSDYHYD